MRKFSLRLTRRATKSNYVTTRSNFTQGLGDFALLFSLAARHPSCQCCGTMTLRLTLLALASAIALRAADALPLFNATLTVGKEHRFVLVDATGKASSFLRLGEKFDGYTLKSYDAKEGALELERDGKTSRVMLVADAAVTDGPALALPATIEDA